MTFIDGGSDQPNPNDYGYDYVSFDLNTEAGGDYIWYEYVTILHE